MLKLDRLSKVYRIGTFGGKALRAVSEVSFEVEDGQVVALIGESGSGKSTIGKMILRLISISSGAISFDGRDIATFQGKALKAYYRKVQGVFQDPFSSFNPVFKADRVFEIIRSEFFPQTTGCEWKGRVHHHHALETVGLNPEHVLGKFPHQLSGGQLQRFLIARALLLDIRFLVADEIISMLDASSRIDVLNLLAELKSAGLSVLFITHDLSLAHYISEKAVILYRGNVLEMGSTDSLFCHPLHPYTRMLLESVPSLSRPWCTTGSAPAAARPAPVSSCVYFERCPVGFERCREAPALIEVEKDHCVACWAAFEKIYRE
jgi:peptide/nickel transport system ATP-binding protein